MKVRFLVVVKQLKDCANLIGWGSWLEVGSSDLTRIKLKYLASGRENPTGMFWSGFSANTYFGRLYAVG